MGKGVRRLSWGDIYSDLVSTDSDYSSCDWGGWNVGSVGHWNVKYFVLTPDILWMNQPCDHLLGRIYPIPSDPATSAARVETGLPSPAQSWVTFVFSSRPWKVLAALGQPGLAGVTSRPHGATEMGGKGMMTSQTYHLSLYAQEQTQKPYWAYNLFFRNSKQSINNQYKT